MNWSHHKSSVRENDRQNQPLASAQVSNGRLSVLHYTEDQKMQSGQPLGKLT